MPEARAKIVPLRSGPDRDESRPADPLEERADDDLMLLASGGHRGAFRVLVERHAARVLRFCTRMTGDRRAGEEIAQETWLSLWSARGSYRPGGQFVVWLLTVARNRCLNARRNDVRRARVLVPEVSGAGVDPPDQAPAQLDRLIVAEERRRVQAALDELPVAMREAVTLRYADALAYDEIAAVAGTSASTVRSRVFHALKKLEELLAGGASQRNGGDA